MPIISEQSSRDCYLARGGFDSGARPIWCAYSERLAR
jgi:hypothetical protein